MRQKPCEKRAIAEFDATRPDRATYNPNDDMLARWRAMRQDPDLCLLVGGFGYSNFWASIDARDAAQALEKGLTADYQGSHPLFVNDSENAAGIGHMANPVIHHLADAPLGYVWYTVRVRHRARQEVHENGSPVRCSDSVP